MKPKLLDLFTGPGGASRGYQRGDFYVEGVDIEETWAGEPPVDWGEFDSEEAQEAREQGQYGDA